MSNVSHQDSYQTFHGSLQHSNELADRISALEAVVFSSLVNVETVVCVGAVFCVVNGKGGVVVDNGAGLAERMEMERLSGSPLVVVGWADE